MAAHRTPMPSATTRPSGTTTCCGAGSRSPPRSTSTSRPRPRQAIADGPARPGRRTRRCPTPRSTSIEPATGFVKAMVGGRDFWGGHSYAKTNLADGRGPSDRIRVQADRAGHRARPTACRADKRFNAPSLGVVPHPGRHVERQGRRDRFRHDGGVHRRVVQHLLRQHHPRRRRSAPRPPWRWREQLGMVTCTELAGGPLGGARRQQRHGARHGLGVRHLRQRRRPRASRVRHQGRAITTAPCSTSTRTPRPRCWNPRWPDRSTTSCPG